MTISIFRNPIIIALILSWSLAVAAEETLMIQIQGDDINLQETDLSHLAVGESEIIYTESGKELTLTRTENGMEVLVDGEEIGPGPHLAKADCNIEVIVESDCEDCEMELHEMVVIADVDGDDFGCPHESGVVKSAWVSEDGEQHVFKRISSHTDGDVSAHEGELHMIVIEKEVIKTIDEN